MDHIHCLKAMSVSDIKNYFSKIVCPDKLRTQTSTAILGKLQAALGNANVFCLPLPGRTNGITMHLWKKKGCISIYQGESSTQPNYCGLVMFVRGRNKSANYTGDCRLSQADDVYTQEINGGLSTNEHVLIAPHHGGDWGPQHRHYSTPCDTIEISVGSNNYKHPNGDMLKYLRSLGNVKRTDAGGGVDITETL